MDNEVPSKMIDSRSHFEDWPHPGNPLDIDFGAQTASIEVEDWPHAGQSGGPRSAGIRHRMWATDGNCLK